MESSKRSSFMIKDILTEKKNECELSKVISEHHFESDSEENEEQEDTRERDDIRDERICDSSGETSLLSLYL